MFLIRQKYLQKLFLKSLRRNNKLLKTIVKKILTLSQMFSTEDGFPLYILFWFYF